MEEQRQALAELRRTLERARAQKRLAKTRLAHRAGLGRTTVWQAFADGQGPPTADTVAALAEALELDAGPLLELLRRATAPPPADDPPVDAALDDARDAAADDSSVQDPPVGDAFDGTRGAAADDSSDGPEGPGGEPSGGRIRVRKLWPSLPSEVRPRRLVAIAVVVLVAVTVVLDPFGRRGPDQGDADQGGDVKPAGVLGDARSADPCALLDAEKLARFGDTSMDPNYGEFDRCDVLVHKGDDGEAVADVNLNFASDPAEPGPPARTEKVGHVTVTQVASDADECLRNIRLADGNQIWIAAKKLGTPAPDLCALARAATDHAAEVLNRGPVPRRRTPFPEGSLAHVDACELLDPAVLSVISGIDAYDPDRGFADWECGWQSATADAGVEVEFSQDNDLTDDGLPTRLGGRRSHVAPKDEGDRTCVVRIEHRGYTDFVGEPTVELVMLTVYGPQPDKELCHTAKTFATAVAKRLPKP